MGGHPADLMAEATAAEHWRDGYRFVILHAPPLRAGRGRPKAQANRKGLQAETWRREEECLTLKVTIARGLRDGSLDPVEAHRQVDAAGWGDCIRVAETRPELVAACAHFFGSGYTVWQVEDAPNSGLPLLEMGFVLLTDARRM